MQGRARADAHRGPHRGLWGTGRLLRAAGGATAVAGTLMAAGVAGAPGALGAAPLGHARTTHRGCAPPAGRVIAHDRRILVFYEPAVGPSLAPRGVAACLVGGGTPMTLAPS